MEKPGWVEQLELKILEISKNAASDIEFNEKLIRYCNSEKIAISTPEDLQERGHVLFLAQKINEVGTPDSLQVLKIKDEQ